MKDTATKERIKKAAMEEFLEKGFREASLRTITAKAHVTTGAFYGYYKDKEALFQDLVEPAAGTMQKRFMDAQARFAAFSEKEQIAEMNQYSNRELQHFFNYIYEHFDVFRLVICGSAGTEYETYLHTLVKIEERSTLQFIDVLKRNGYQFETPDTNLLHILSNAYFSAMFETVVHNMTKEEADQYVKHITGFFSAGWGYLFGMR
ncbi:MAG: TetR/AcrR family transcriptional regulator [Christensenellaceae bacterium]|jgi:AcrR family transcriptional regulator